ncbi:SGNH/GDSL hydrolase family protein [Micromonospora sp. NPDC094482]|uniref:SGNH/GDSL hydrolase family protein n=1 Tax=unclassified Micromonospora TaxID=2617518 RepID=UPI00333348BB
MAYDYVEVNTACGSGCQCFARKLEGVAMSRLLLPVAAAQGLWMRRTVKMAPPAAGPTSGRVATHAGQPLDLVVLGDSTAAGCGVGNHQDGFAANLAGVLSTRTGRPVHWKVVGEFGATARRIRYRLLPQVGDEFHVAVLLAGGNDVMARRSPEQWREDLSVIVNGLVECADQVVVVGIPPFGLFPSLPTALRRYLGSRAAALDEVSRQVCASHLCATWVTTTGAPPPEFFGSDRFHPSAFGYRLWARLAADAIVL